MCVGRGVSEDMCATCVSCVRVRVCRDPHVAVMLVFGLASLRQELHEGVTGTLERVLADTEDKVCADTHTHIHTHTHERSSSAESGCTKTRTHTYWPTQKTR